MRKKASDGEKHSQAVSVLKAVGRMVLFHRGNFFDCLAWEGGAETKALVVGVGAAAEGGDELL